jgi:hypothetical protein
VHAVEEKAITLLAKDNTNSNALPTMQQWQQLHKFCPQVMQIQTNQFADTPRCHLRSCHRAILCLPNRISAVSIIKLLQTLCTIDVLEKQLQQPWQASRIQRSLGIKLHAAGINLTSCFKDGRLPTR